MAEFQQHFADFQAGWADPALKSKSELCGGGEAADQGHCFHSLRRRFIAEAEADNVESHRR